MQLRHEYFFSVGGKIKRWDAPKCHVLVEVLAGDGEPTSGVKYVGKLIDHKYELNYANSGAAKHIVVIGIKEMIPYESEHMKKIA